MKTILLIEPEFAETLRAAGLTEFDVFMRTSAGPPTSKHKYRETVPLDISIGGAAKRFYLKRVFRVPPRHALVPWLKFQRGYSQPRLEWDILGKLNELSQLGISAMKRVAIGERRLAGVPVSAFLLVEAVPMQYTLENWLVPGFEKPYPPLQPRERNRILYELGRQFGLLHASRFRWPDIHPKHIFARPAAEPRKRWTWEFCLIDVERMTQFEDGLHFEVSKEFVPIETTSLGELNLFLRNLCPPAVSRWELLRFWAGYCSVSRGIAGRNLRRGPHWLPSWATIDEGPRLPDDYENPRAEVPNCAESIFQYDYAQTLLQRAGIRSLADAFDLQSGDDLRKPGLESYRDRIRLRVSDGNDSTKTVYVKRYRSPPAGSQLRRMFATGPFHGSAFHEKRFNRRLAQIGVPTARLLAFGQEMIGPWELGSFSITEGLTGDSLEQLLNGVEADPARAPSFRDRREIIRQLALLVRLLHRQRLFHRDLYLCHIILTRNADGGIVLCVIDLARMIENPLQTRRWIIKDLAALQYSARPPVVTRADRLRFCRNYYGPDACKSRMRRDLADIQARVRRMARHDENRAIRFARKEPA